MHVKIVKGYTKISRFRRIVNQLVLLETFQEGVFQKVWHHYILAHPIQYRDSSGSQDGFHTKDIDFCSRRSFEISLKDIN